MPPLPAEPKGRSPGGPAGPRRWLFLVAHDREDPRVTGGDLLATDLAEALAARGDEVELWSSRHSGRPLNERVNGVRVHRLPPQGLLAPSIWAHFLAGRARGFHAVVEQVVGSQRLPFLARMFSPIPTLGVWYQDNVPLFEAAYRGRTLRQSARFLQRMLLLVYSRGPLLTCSTTSARWLEGRGIAPDRIGLFYPRVNRAGPNGALPPFSQRENLFVVIGNFRATKRFEEALEVLREVRRGGVDARCALVGRANDPVYLDRLRALAQAPDLRGSVDILVDLSEAAKFELLLRAKALTVHSPIEGFGWTVIEAGRQGVPAVVNPGVPEDARGSEGGAVVVPFGDVRAYARAVSLWMTSPELWSQASRAARRHSERFSGSVLTSDLRDFLARTFP